MHGPGTEAICTVAVRERGFGVANCICGTNGMHHHGIFFAALVLNLIFLFVCLNFLHEVVVSFSASSELTGNA